MNQRGSTRLQSNRQGGRMSAMIGRHFRGWAYPATSFVRWRSAILRLSAVFNVCVAFFIFPQPAASRPERTKNNLPSFNRMRSIRWRTTNGENAGIELRQGEFFRGFYSV